MSLSQRVYKSWIKVHEDNGQLINLSKLAGLLGTRVATLWSYHHGKAKWPADLWILTMILTGGARVEGNSITIEVPDEILDPAHPIGFTDVVLRSKPAEKEKK